VIPRYGAKITAASREQSIRGTKYGPYRPQLVILDDVEDLESTTHSKESCDKTYDWFTGDVLPIGDKRTRIVLLGNRLGEDSLLPRVIGKIKDGSLPGTYRVIPLLDEKGNIAWIGKYPTPEEVENQRQMGDDAAWRREFLLQNVPRLGRVVHPEWIPHYDRLPPTDAGDYLYTVTSIDPASSLGSDAAFTAMVSAQIHGHGDQLRVYILPGPVNERMEFPDIIERAKQVSLALGNGYPTDIVVEEVQSQVYITHELLNQGFPASGIKIHGNDKRQRLTMTTHLIQSGKVLFPRKGAEELIDQLVNFDISKYKDLADAFANLILEIMKNVQSRAEPEVFIVSAEDDDD
jgi:phage terminase large subunit-like protein